MPGSHALATCTQESERIRSAAEAKGEEARQALERSQAQLRRELGALHEAASEAVASNSVAALAGACARVKTCSCVLAHAL